jgi:ring-1,2-phenylacetyl-CoA epoxidase subunit PaaB
MSTIHSLDPRITRANITEEIPLSRLEEQELFETFEVFHQAKSGARHTHVGSVHAPNAEMAYLFAKEQYGRRMQTHNIWVVRTSDIVTAEQDDMLYETATQAEKEYRNANIWKVRDKIDRFKKSSAQEASEISEQTKEQT